MTHQFILAASAISAFITVSSVTIAVMKDRHTSKVVANTQGRTSALYTRLFIHTESIRTNCEELCESLLALAGVTLPIPLERKTKNQLRHEALFNDYMKTGKTMMGVGVPPILIAK
jgi:hypothetical protein